LQQLAITGLSSGRVSVANISGGPSQTLAGPSDSLQSVQFSADISVMSQQHQDESTAVQQQTVNEEHCLDSSESSSAHCPQPSQVHSESSQISDVGLSQPSVDVLESSPVVVDVTSLCSELQPADCDGDQPPQLTSTDSHSDIQPVPCAKHSQPDEPTSHSRIIEQLQKQLLQSSAKQALNGCHMTVNDEDCQSHIVGCRVEDGEVDSNELMQFLS